MILMKAIHALPKKLLRKTGRLLHIGLFTMALAPMVSANVSHANDSPHVANFTVVAGSVNALRNKGETPITAKIGTKAMLQDTVLTKKRSRTQLKFIDNSILNMGQDFKMNIEEYTYDKTNGVRKAILDLVEGTVEVAVEKLGSETVDFTVNTPSAVISVRGTRFILKVGTDSEGNPVTIATVTEGWVELTQVGDSSGKGNKSSNKDSKSSDKDSKSSDKDSKSSKKDSKKASKKTIILKAGESVTFKRNQKPGRVGRTNPTYLALVKAAITMEKSGSTDPVYVYVDDNHEDHDPIIDDGDDVADEQSDPTEQLPATAAEQQPGDNNTNPVVQNRTTGNGGGVSPN